MFPSKSFVDETDMQLRDVFLMPTYLMKLKFFK